MKKVLFSSIDGGSVHQGLILAQLDEIMTIAQATSDIITLEVMTFAFAGTDIATAMETLVAQCDTIHIKILADWSQGAPKSPSVVSRLAAHPSGRITLKYKLDLPYSTDPISERVSWRYHTSHGMLHHKTMLMTRAGHAERLILGSFNWSARGAVAYENTLLLVRDGVTDVVLDAFCAEFAALWGDFFASVASAQAA
jgi:phosphatidylserine/phosphatidylglycerophosphate/cardiolipin synthase-like enzyme